VHLESAQLDVRDESEPRELSPRSVFLIISYSSKAVRSSAPFEASLGSSGLRPEQKECGFRVQALRTYIISTSYITSNYLIKSIKIQVSALLSHTVHCTLSCINACVFAFRICRCTDRESVLLIFKPRSPLYIISFLRRKCGLSTWW
jgi:hypothetical protein